MNEERVCDIGSLMVNSRRRRSQKQCVSVWIVMKYLSANNNNEIAFKWIVENIKTRSVRLSNKFEVQFDALRELYEFVNNLGSGNRSKWIAALKDAIYKTPRALYGWPLLFGQNVLPLCNHFMDADLTFLRKKRKLESMKRSTSNKVVPCMSAYWRRKVKEPVKVTGVSRFVNYKMKYIRALQKANSLRKREIKLAKKIKLKEIRVNSLKRKNKYLINKIKKHDRCHSKCEKVLALGCSSSSIPKKCKEDPQKANESIVLQLNVPTTDSKMIVIPSSINGLGTGNEVPSTNMSKILTPKALPANYDVATAEVSKNKDKKKLDLTSNPTVSDKYFQRDKSMISYMPQLANPNVIASFEYVRKILNHIKLVCAESELSDHLGDAVIQCEENVEFLKRCMIETELKCDHYKRSVQEIQSYLSSCETDLKSTLDKKDRLEKKYIELKKKLNKVMTATSKSDSQDAAQKLIDKRNDLELVECQKRCVMLKEDERNLKLFVKEELNAFKVAFEFVKAAVGQVIIQEAEKENEFSSIKAELATRESLLQNARNLHEQHLASFEEKEKECDALRKFIFAVKETFGFECNSADDVMPLNEENEMEQFKAYHYINKNNFKKCSMQITSMSQKINKFKVEHVRRAKKEKLLQIRLQKLGKNVRSLRYEAKRVKIAYLTENKCSNSDNNNNNIDHSVLSISEPSHDSAAKNEELESKIVEYNILLGSCYEENKSLNARCDELKGLLDQEHAEATRQLELQLAMFLSTSDRYREQIKRIENSL